MANPIQNTPDNESLIETRVAATDPIDEALPPTERDPDALGAAVGLAPAPEEPLAVKEELERRDRQRLDGSSDEPR